MKNLTKTILTVLATGLVSCALFSPQAQADPITGQISFNGVVQFNDSNLNNVTQVTQWFDTNGLNPGTAEVAFGATGSFAGTPAGTHYNFANPWVFGMVNGGPQLALWSGPGPGGFTMTFNLTSSTVIQRSATGIIIQGTGVLHSTNPNLQDSVGVWDFRVTNAGGQNQVQFAFSASTAAVPDGGSAVALLGVALAGVEVLRRKFARK